MVQEVEESRLPQMAGPGGGANAESSSEQIKSWHLWAGFSLVSILCHLTFGIYEFFE